ncbi:MULTISPECIES: alpha/beta fold hydrolase [Mammaliicoccus]|uniref:alpha/beta fold hydrolase n=1 Tax=Mammaliicoccus TaxID=2803850 RepID=UPI000D1D2532|nr:MULTISPECIES: alpha/beta hydrolase [Mammaliicoccus]PTI82566.1 alpha/beta hydrolase [Mammaliicoccus vitulinus]QQT15328.1 alpha/beta hydrolase [Mammaliicoccus vitulinus]QQY19371.1 alpha/beta hydrolase [Mammaliicoccus vitulinus]RIN21368.1 alpha/beta hydrolase [Mammaliicoccus vitulinus]RTX88215.1 alpha/beta hydrolase [Mammaliicoccus vitulinus]
MQTNEVKGMFNATGANIYFESKGNGENILLLHAGIADSRMWDNKFHLLSEKYRVVRLDLPGFGLSDFTGGNYSYSNIINEILTHLDINHTHILAASFDGKIAIDFYLDHSEKCLSLALLSPALGGWQDSSFLQDYEEEEEKLLREGKIEETALFNYKTWILRNRSPELINTDVKQLVVDMQMEFLTKPESDYSCEEVETKDNILQIKNIQIPVLIINGKYDIQDFHDISELMSKELPYVKKIIIPDTAHLANLESPNHFFKLISEFFSDS